MNRGMKRNEEERNGKIPMLNKNLNINKKHTKNIQKTLRFVRKSPGKNAICNCDIFRRVNFISHKTKYLKEKKIIEIK